MTTMHVDTGSDAHRVAQHWVISLRHPAKETDWPLGAVWPESPEEGMHLSVCKLTTISLLCGNPWTFTKALCSRKKWKSYFRILSYKEQNEIYGWTRKIFLVMWELYWGSSKGKVGWLNNIVEWAWGEGGEEKSWLLGNALWRMT